MESTAVIYDFKTLRKALGLTQEGLAYKCHTSPRIVGAIENYGYVPTYATRKKLARGLEVKMEDLWLGADDD